MTTIKKIFLVNATTYTNELDKTLQKIRENYFRVKGIAKSKIIGLPPLNNIKSKTYSLGLLRIATILKENRFDVQYVDMEDLLQIITSTTEHEFPDIVGFSSVTPTIPLCAKLCEIIKKISPVTRVMIGGPHVNVAPQLTMSKYPCFDKYIVGYDLRAAAEISSLSVNSLSIPRSYVDYSLLPLPLSEYSINVFSTLGCLYNCDYCQDNYVPYTENDINAGLLALKECVPEGTPIHYFDSVLGVTKQRAKLVCTDLMKMGHGYKLSCDMRAEFITPSFVRLLEEAGFVEVRLGIESTDSETLAINKRTLSYSKLYDAIQTIRENSDLYITLYCVTGLPGSTQDSLCKTRDRLCGLLRSNYVDEIKNTIYVPYPIDSKDYSSRGLEIIDNNWTNYDRQSFPVYNLKNLLSQEIWEEFILLSKNIVDNWIISLGYQSINQFPEILWSEYLVDNHLLNHRKMSDSAVL